MNGMYGACLRRSKFVLTILRWEVHLRRASPVRGCVVGTPSRQPTTPVCSPPFPRHAALTPSPSTMAATPPQHDIASIVVDAASQVYHFLTQPTEPIALLPLIPPSSMPLAKQTATSSVNAVRPPPAAHAHAPTMSAIGGGGNGLWESLGIVAAVAAVELARFGWRRYRERAAIQAEDDAWQQRSRQRIKELTERSPCTRAG